MRRVVILLSLAVFLTVSCEKREIESQVSNVSFTPCQQKVTKSEISDKVNVEFTNQGVQITYYGFAVTCDFTTVDVTHTFVNGVLDITQQGSPNQANCICYTDVSYTINGISQNEVNVIFINDEQVYCHNDDDDFLQIREKAVDTLAIGSNSFVLEAYLWRDFMPVSPPNGQPMISINWLISTDLVRIPNNISMVKQYVFYNDEIWVSDYENEAPAPSLPEYKLERISRNGPKWGPHIYVDVISQIHDSQSNKDYYIKRKNVYVLRTD
jgi:hypothetical protein